MSDITIPTDRLIACKTCGQLLARGKVQLLARGKVKILRCKTCGQPFSSGHSGRLYCDRPGVYRFVCPDGRSYVGAVGNINKRGYLGVARSNPRLLTADTWAYEVLERLPPGCSWRELRKAEQKQIDRLRSWAPEFRFNIHRAVWDIDGPAQRAARQWRAALLASTRKEQAARRAAERVDGHPE
jgi:hypothetical protein